MSIGSSSNPFMKESYFENISADNQSMTVEGTISKTLILIFSAIFAASFSWKFVLDNPASMNSLLTIGGISGFCLALITALAQAVSIYSSSLFVGGRSSIRRNLCDFKQDLSGYCIKCGFDNIFCFVNNAGFI